MRRRLPPLRRGDAEPVAEPPGEGARRGEPEQLRDVGQRVAVVGQVALGQRARGSRSRSRRSSVPPRRGAGAASAGSPRGCGPPGASSSGRAAAAPRPARAPGPDTVAAARRRHRLEELLRVGPQQRIGHRVRGVELGRRRSTSPVNGWSNCSRGPNAAQVGGRAPPERGGRSRPTAAPTAWPSSSRMIPSSAAVASSSAWRVGAGSANSNHSRMVASPSGLVQPQAQRLVVAVLVADQQAQGAAQVRLLAQHDAERAEGRRAGGDRPAAGRSPRARTGRPTAPAAAPRPPAGIHFSGAARSATSSPTSAGQRCRVEADGPRPARRSRRARRSGRTGRIGRITPGACPNKLRHLSEIGTASHGAPLPQLFRHKQGTHDAESSPALSAVS